jgi:hypothetical protein
VEVVGARWWRKAGAGAPVVSTRGVDYHGGVVAASYARAERTSLRLHEAVAQRALTDHELVERARRRVATWLEDGSVARPYAEAWAKLLAAPIADLAAALCEQSERMHDLRQVSPFAGALDARERWRLRREAAR